MRHAWILLGCLATLPGPGQAEEAVRPFAIEVVDDRTGRGVPLVELQTTAGVRYYTDSAGLIAIDEPALMGRKVYFGGAAHGYEFPADGFGIRGVVLPVEPGQSATVKIRRLNIAERLYRTTGLGIYRDTERLGWTPPLGIALLNAEVTGQDSIMTALHRGKTYWFYGDTGRLSYALGNFAMAGATSGPPESIDPAVGIKLNYFAGPDGFARKMAPRPGEGVVWLNGMVVLPDEAGVERIYAYFERRRGLGAVLESGFMRYDDDRDVFEKLKDVPLNPTISPGSAASRIKGDDGIDRLHFSSPYPSLRVKADVASYLDLAAYEAYTCLKPGTRDASRERVQLDRDAEGRLVWAWKAATAPLNPKDQAELVRAGLMRADESPFRLRDADGGKAILVNNSSCCWNAYRKRYVLIASEVTGATVLGEVWYSEADRPEGPWIEARKIITHANKPGDPHDFYNPIQHAFLDRDGGKTIFIEGTYVNTFSGNPHPTPYYEYNQIIYRLDLSDPKLALPGR